MLGLIYKDFSLLKVSSRTFLLMIGLFGLIGISQGEPSLFGSMSGMMILVLPINCFSYDQMAGWDAFAAASPVDRRTMVAARYLTVLIMCAAGFTLSVLMGWATALIHPNRAIEIFAPAGGIAMAGLCMMSFMLPALYKFGVEKSRIIMMFFFALPFILIVGVGKLVQIGTLTLPEISEQMVRLSIYAAIPVLLILYGLSYRLSAGIYSRKDL